MLETSLQAAAAASAAARDMLRAAPGDSSTMCCSTEEDSVSKLFDSISSKTAVCFNLHKYI